MSVGSLRKCSIKGISFNIMGDTDLSLVPTKFENTSIPTSGPRSLKQEKRALDVSDFVIACSANDLKTLKGIAEGGEEWPLSYTEADGTTWKSTGNINIDSRTSMEGRATLMLLPEDEWTY